ncbi:hypothetical protein [Burkholderia multivorans]|uniref:hypothetical protein n=1 Tax=Burkholderia multivorans TaxID=87883 RepID=UPI002ED2C0CB|nr:hypothetical protein V1241_23815 [Burkholderia multivorans]
MALSPHQDGDTTLSSAVDIPFPEFEVARNTQLYNDLCNEVIEPGSGLDYALAKRIYLEHPLGSRIVDSPITLAFTQKREISGVPEEAKKAFLSAWKQARADVAIKNTARHARIYGAGTLVDLGDGTFKVYDPLLTAGSIVGNIGEPLSRDFLTADDPVVRGSQFNNQNSIVLYNGAQVYLAYSASAFSYGGRSVFYNMLPMLAGFLYSIDVDTLVLKKAGALVAKTKPVGAAGNRITQFFRRKKADDVKRALNGNVIAIETDESIETINMTNSDDMVTARDNMISNIATAMDAPALILKNAVLTQGFGEGSEDAKILAQYVERYREEIECLFDWITPKIQALAWSEEWYQSFQMSHPEYASISYQSAINFWKANFSFAWPNYLSEPDSEKRKGQKDSFDAYMQVYRELQSGIRNPENRRALAQTMIDLTQSDAFKTLLPEPILITFDEDDFAAPAPTEFKGSIKESEDLDGAADTDDKSQSNE